MELMGPDMVAIEELTRLTVERCVVETSRQVVVEVYEDRFGSMPTELRAVVEGTDDRGTLRAWHRLAVVGTAEEIAAAIRGGAGS